MLQAGARLGPYEIVSSLGAGGMGEVYRARDARLKRDVALKILPDSFASNPDRLARFQREAEVLASLNHPNIAAIHGFEESEVVGAGFSRIVSALVLELVEGETLADRIARGAIPLDEALPTARQIAAALETAHEHGVIHRDLKPANIKITPDGVVKVLDFGLAKLHDPHAQQLPSGAAALSMSPTLTSPALVTGAGVLLGTAAYMSPEQARGREADKRSDVWAFGCVVFEMLAGRRAFEGDDISDTIASILRGEPDWRALPTSVPPSVRELLRHCLHKDRQRRIPDIGAARFEIDRILTAPDQDGASSGPARRPFRRTVVMVAGVTAAACGLTAFVVWSSLRPEPAAVTRFAVTTPLPAAFDTGPAGVNLVISPDGAQVVYHVRRGNGELEIRRFDQLESQPLTGTDDARHPSFSPDGRKIAFAKQGQLYTLSLDTQSLVPLCAAVNVTGTSWAGNTHVVFAVVGPQGGIYRIPVEGGQPELIASPPTRDGREEYVFPDVLPAGDAMLFTIARGPDQSGQIAFRRFESDEQRIVIERGTYPRYASTGHLLYAQGATLMAAPFDAGRGEVTGSAVAMQQGVGTKGTGEANYAMSRTGTLVYAPGSGVPYISRFVWMDRTGKVVGAVAPDRLDAPRYPRLSPDGRRLAATVGGAQDGHIWVYDLTNTTPPAKLTYKAHNTMASWTPDGQRIVFASTLHGSQRNFYVVPADGSKLDAERLLTSEFAQNQSDWSADGIWLMFQQASASTRNDIWVVQRGSRDPQPWLQTQFNETEPSFSPDGRWVAYVSDQTGAAEVWVRPFPGPGSPVRVFPNGGRDTVWAPDGAELFYQEGRRMMSAAVTVSASDIRLAPPRMLFEGGFIPWEPNTPRTYDVAADGRFLMIEETRDYLTNQFVVVLNWVEELRRQVAN